MATLNFTVSMIHDDKHKHKNSSISVTNTQSQKGNKKQSIFENLGNTNSAGTEDFIN